MKHQDQPKELKVIARAPFHVYYEGMAKRVSAANQVGDFDILPGHAGFFSVMTPGQVIIETNAEPVQFQISNGIISVQNGEAVLFVNM